MILNAAIATITMSEEGSEALRRRPLLALFRLEKRGGLRTIWHDD